MPNFAHFSLAFGSQMLGKEGSETFFPLPHVFMGKPEAPNQEEFRHITDTQLVTQSAQQDLKHDVSWHLNIVEWCICAFIEGAPTFPAAKHCVSEIGGAL